MITILGAGGVIGNEFVKLLAARKQEFRLVGRNPRNVAGATETVSADLTDQEQTIRAVRIMNNTIEACKRARARLVFFDNVYMYGRVSGPMTEESPFNPRSKKGEVRAKIATSLIEEWSSGKITAMIARAADFYGPQTQNAVPNLLVFEPLSKNQKASWLVNDSVPHSYTYTVDAAQSLLTLAESESAWNQTWHVPTTPNPLTGKQFVAMAAKEFGVAAKHRVLNRTMIRLPGSDAPYLFDSSKFAKAFGFSGTPYADGIRATAASFKEAVAAKR